MIKVSELKAMDPGDRLTFLHNLIEAEKKIVRGTVGTMPAANALIAEMKAAVNGGSFFSLEDAITQKAKQTVYARIIED